MGCTPEGTPACLAWGSLSLSPPEWGGQWLSAPGMLWVGPQPASPGPPRDQAGAICWATSSPSAPVSLCPRA